MPFKYYEGKQQIQREALFQLFVDHHRKQDFSEATPEMMAVGSMQRIEREAYRTGKHEFKNFVVVHDGGSQHDMEIMHQGEMDFHTPSLLRRQAE